MKKKRFLQNIRRLGERGISMLLIMILLLGSISTDTFASFTDGTDAGFVQGTENVTVPEPVLPEPEGAEDFMDGDQAAQTPEPPVSEPPEALASPTPEPPEALASPTPEPPEAIASPTPEPPEAIATPTPEPTEALASPTPELPEATATPTPEPTEALASPTPEPPEAIASPTPEPTEALTPTPTPTGVPGSIAEPSDGSLAGTIFYFKNATGSVEKLIALFDGGTDICETELLLNEEGYYVGQVPEGDYSRITFLTVGEEGTKIPLTQAFRFYGGETALENTTVFTLTAGYQDVYYYDPQSVSYWTAFPIVTEAPEQNRIIEPSEGYLAGEMVYFVNLYWEEQDLGDVYAIFEGGTLDDQKILMTRSERGKYSVTIPQGDYSRISFGKPSGEAVNEEPSSTESSETVMDAFTSGEVTETSESAQAEKETYSLYGTPFQYYGIESAAENCVPVFYVPGGAFDTYYYDTNAPERSYWGADALYEAPIGGAALFAVSEEAAKTGATLYFADLTPPDGKRLPVKRVTMQFWDAGHAETGPMVSSVMYEGRDGIFSAPIPPGGYEEVSFLMEFDGGYSYQMVRHYNIYKETVGEETPGSHMDEAFVFEEGVMDTFFFNDVADQITVESMLDSYWGPHPSVMERQLSGEVFYVDTSDRNNDAVFLDPTTLTIDYGNGPVRITRYTRDPGIYYYQFPMDCTATEHTILTLRGNLGYGDNYGGDRTEQEIVFRFYYPYNSARKMIVTDYIREQKPVFEEFVLQDADHIYLIYDNKTTGFSNIQYRVRKEDSVTWTAWTNLDETDPNEWVDKPNAAVVEELWGTEITSDYKYVQFRGTTRNEDWVREFTVDKGFQRINGKRRENPYLWRTTNEIQTESTRIPSEQFSYPCYYGLLHGQENDPNATTPNMDGVWLAALDIRNFGDSTMNIPEGSFTKEANSYYGITTFYDYYTDPELLGRQRSGDNTAKRINESISAYYKEMAAPVKPLYLNQQFDYSNTLYGYDVNLNSWAMDKRAFVTSGAVDGQLGEDNMLLSGGVAVPVFNEDFLRGGNAEGANLGQVYNNVYFPFVKNENGYWEFDSAVAEETFRMKYDVNDGYFLERTGDPLTVVIDGKTLNSFFPFNDPKDQNHTDDRSKLDFLFGTRFDIPFTLPEGNEVVMEEGAPAEPVTFTFSGDDDAWVFVDGQLLLDIGGIHDAITGTINFKNGTATVSASGDKNNQALTKQFELDPTRTEHVLTMYYMERGLGSSNLKVTFNFPKQNSLNVTNEIDTSAANPIFADALDNIGSFAYRIANQVTSGGSLPVEESAGYVSLGQPTVFDEVDQSSKLTFDEAYTSATIADGSLVIRQKQALTGLSSEEEIIRHLAELSYRDGGSLDISEQAYLRFLAYNDSDAEDNAGENIFVSLRDADGNRIGGWASRLAYDGSSNSLGSREWALVQVDINKLRYMNGAASFDRTRVQAIGFATRAATPMFFDTLEFYKAIEILPSHGFSVEQEDISDYGSVQNGAYTLSEVNGAWYGHYRAGMGRSTYRMAENGFISVGNNERAEFLDKFRVGAYLQITQEDIDSRVFDTWWSIREGVNQDAVLENYLLPSRTDTETVRNTGEAVGREFPLESNIGTRPSDGRIVLAGDSEIARPEGGSFVYRSYAKPDDDEIDPVDLTVAFQNRLKVGSLTVNKNLSLKDNETAAGAVYEFEVRFYNVAGMALEDAPISYIVPVTIGADGKTGSVTIEGIPAGTRYQIRELETSGLEVKEIVPGAASAVNPHENVGAKVETVGGEPSWYAYGTAYASDQAFTFTNTVEPFRMKIEKRWEDEGAKENRPSVIGIRILRKTASQSEWQNVTKTFFDEAIGENGQEYISLSEKNALEDDPDIWAVETKDLDAIDGTTGEVYSYKIEETEAAGADGWSLANYIPTYIQGEPGTGKYVVINRPNRIEVVKEWEDADDGHRPTAIRAQLQRRLEQGGTEAYENVGKPVDISTHSNPAWKHVFEAVERVDENGERYHYRVIETHLIYSNDSEIPVSDGKETTDGYAVSYEENEQNTVLTIKNAKGTGHVQLLKKDRSDQSLIPGAVFKLERLKPFEKDASEEETEFTDGGYNDKLWTVDKNYSVVEYTTNENGLIDFAFLPFGYYRVTEVKAPQGYVKLETPYDFRITQEVVEALREQGKDTLIIEIENQPILALPVSGASGTMMFTLTGAVLIIAALFLYKLHLKKGKGHSKSKL